MQKEVCNTASCAIIIVTHNSLSYLEKCLAAISKQSYAPKQVLVVDSGSYDVSALLALTERFKVTIHLEKKNVGFCEGNNIGLSLVDPNTKYVLFLNPDVYLTSTFIEVACAHLDDPLAEDVGALSGLLLGYDHQLDRPTGLIDSTGIFQSWYGKWKDRGQGDSIQKAYDFYHRSEFVPALCGALMFCRLDALRQVEFSQNIVMDPSFYMYKEDIDLSLRLRQKGWKLLYVPDLIAYHCRGWNVNRKEMSYPVRVLSAKNEMTLHARHSYPHYFYSAFKYYCVKLLNV